MKQLISIMMCVALLASACASSQKTTEKTQAEQQEQSVNDFKKLTKDAEKHEGYFDLYQNESDLYISVPKERLDKQFLMNFELAEGIGAAGLYGGSMLTIFEGLLVSLEKHEGKIFLINHPHRYKAGSSTPVAKAVEMSFGESVMTAKGHINPGEPVPEDFVDEALKWVTMHEVGHTLGLRHNFRSSIDTPLDRLYDESWTQKNGVFSSVMDYPSVNLNPKGKAKDGHYYNPSVGSYDQWAVSYGYTRDDEKAEKIARQSAKAGHAYGTDGDARGAGAVDPHVNVYDLGSDPLAWSKGRADLLRGMIPRIPDIMLEDNAPYYKATDLFQSYLYQYARTLTPAVKYIGGQHQYRDHVGDPEGRQPFVPVSREKQQQALDMIINNAFNPDAVELPQEVYQKMGANRWSHWGNSTTYGGRIDYPLHQTLAGIQSALLEQLLDPVRLSRIRDTEVKFGAENTITIPELMGSLTDAIWKEIGTSPGSNIESNRRDLQRNHLNRMVKLVTNKPEEVPADARSVARQQLQDLDNKLTARLAPPTYDFDKYTRAHLEESKARIEAALEAGLNIES